MGRTRRDRMLPWPSPSGHNTRSHETFPSACPPEGLTAKAREVAVVVLSSCLGAPRPRFPLPQESQVFAVHARSPLPSVHLLGWWCPPCSSEPHRYPPRAVRSPPRSLFPGFLQPDPSRSEERMESRGLLSVSLPWLAHYPRRAFRRFPPCRYLWPALGPARGRCSGEPDFQRRELYRMEAMRSCLPRICTRSGRLLTPLRYLDQGTHRSLNLVSFLAHAAPQAPRFPWFGPNFFEGVLRTMRIPVSILYN